MKRARIPLAIATLALSGCLGTGAPALDEQTLFAAQLEQGRRLATDTLEVRGRLSNLELALTLGAAEFCGNLTRPKLGGVFGSSRSFSGVAARAVAEESLGLGEDPTVAHVSPGGPLAQGQILPGDRILAVNGTPVASIADIGAVMQANPERLELLVRRGEQNLERTVVPAATCPVSLGLAASPALVPWKVSKFSAGVPLGLLNLLDRDDELAVVLGHQLAHLLFDRPEDDALIQERRADRLGMYLAARAGYDVTAAPRAWEKVIVEYPWLIRRPRARSRYRVYPHPSVALRMDGIRAAVKEIEELRSQGHPLVPGVD
jgi:hypothetical protein